MINSRRAAAKRKGGSTNITASVLSLAPCKHTLQLIAGGDDHVIRAYAPHSKMITITVQ
ncbi:MAG: hypothetical protein WBX05_22840 [Pseudolabrys sp.]